MNDRSQGGSSLEDGSLELMLHRRLLYDDNLGVEEPLNEMVNGKKGLVVKGIVSMLFDTVPQSAKLHRELAHQIYNKPLVTFSLKNEPSLSFLSGFSMLDNPLPSNLHLLTLMPDYTLDIKKLKPTIKALIVRIEHIYEKDEDPLLSKPATINLKNVFSKMFKIQEVEELNLGGNMPVGELDERLKWTHKMKNSSSAAMFEYRERRRTRQVNDEKYTFTFDPMQIRTFRLILC